MSDRSPSTEYRGYRIQFNENTDEWSVHGLMYSNMSYLKCKKYVDNYYLKLRKESSLDVLTLDVPRVTSEPSSVPSFTTGRMIDYSKPIRAGGWNNSNADEIVDHDVYISQKRDGARKASRRGVKLSRLVKPGRESEKVLKDITETWRKLCDLQGELDSHMARLPRFAIEDIQGLVEASKNKELDE